MDANYLLQVNIMPKISCVAGLYLLRHVCPLTLTVKRQSHSLRITLIIMLTFDLWASIVTHKSTMMTYRRNSGFLLFLSLKTFAEQSSFMAE